ncbi:hypothetical protein C8Q79DRAFT_929764 [Trametes meyenii]|nr:hypothetical protein C8Q79DRAFT_929764 [Trametes meyenii]
MARLRRHETMLLPSSGAEENNTRSPRASNAAPPVADRRTPPIARPTNRPKASRALTTRTVGPTVPQAGMAHLTRESLENADMVTVKRWAKLLMVPHHKGHSEILDAIFSHRAIVPYPVRKHRSLRIAATEKGIVKQYNIDSQGKMRFAEKRVKGKNPHKGAILREARSKDGPPLRTAQSLTPTEPPTPSSGGQVDKEELAPRFSRKEKGKGIDRGDLASPDVESPFERPGRVPLGQLTEEEIGTRFCTRLQPEENDDEEAEDSTYAYPPPDPMDHRWLTNMQLTLSREVEKLSFDIGRIRQEVADAVVQVTLADAEMDVECKLYTDFLTRVEHVGGPEVMKALQAMMDTIQVPEFEPDNYESDNEEEMEVDVADGEADAAAAAQGAQRMMGVGRPSDTLSYADPSSPPPTSPLAHAGVRAKRRRDALDAAEESGGSAKRGRFEEEATELLDALHVDLEGLPKEPSEDGDGDHDGYKSDRSAGSHRSSGSDNDREGSDEYDNDDDDDDNNDDGYYDDDSDRRGRSLTRDPDAPLPTRTESLPNNGLYGFREGWRGLSAPPHARGDHHDAYWCNVAQPEGAPVAEPYYESDSETSSNQPEPTFYYHHGEWFMLEDDSPLCSPEALPPPNFPHNIPPEMSWIKQTTIYTTWPTEPESPTAREKARLLRRKRVSELHERMRREKEEEEEEYEDEEEGEGDEDEDGGAGPSGTTHDEDDKDDGGNQDKDTHGEEGDGAVEDHEGAEDVEMPAAESEQAEDSGVDVSGEPEADEEMRDADEIAEVEQQGESSDAAAAAVQDESQEPEPEPEPPVTPPRRSHRLRGQPMRHTPEGRVRGNPFNPTPRSRDINGNKIDRSHRYLGGWLAGEREPSPAIS